MHAPGELFSRMMQCKRHVDSAYGLVNAMHEQAVVPMSGMTPLRLEGRVVGEKELQEWVAWYRAFEF